MDEKQTNDAKMKLTQERNEDVRVAVGQLCEALRAMEDCDELTIEIAWDVKRGSVKCRIV